MVVALRHLGSSHLWRHAVVALASGVAIASAAALIALFGILSSPSTLPVGSFCMVSFISFTDIVWLILIGGGEGLTTSVL